MLAIGQLVGNYVVVRQLGEGGMGMVYEAVHQYIGRRAAIKVQLPEASRNSQAVSRFLNEARAVNLVKHPSLVEIFEFGLLPEGILYIIMEYLEGETLGDRIRRLGRALAPEALTLARQIALPLAVAHAKEIIHRDLKPDNVMIVADPERPGRERVKVLDFGVAKMTAPKHTDPGIKTETGTTVGTPKYMAPEQCSGVTNLSGHADVYSLGVILYEMLTGKPPFDAELSFDIMAMHVRAAAQPLREMDPLIPDEVAGLVHDMLAKKPADRPPMAEVAKQLALLGAQSSGEAVPVGGPISSSEVVLPQYIVNPSMEEILAVNRLPATPTPRPRSHRTPGPGGDSHSMTVARPSSDPGQANGETGKRGERRSLAGKIALAALWLTVLGGVAVYRSTVPGPVYKKPGPAKMSTVHWVLTTEPERVEVVRLPDQQVLGTTPWTRDGAAVPGEQVLLLRHKGFADKQVTLPLGADARLHEKLDRLPEVKQEETPALPPTTGMDKTEHPKDKVHRPPVKRGGVKLVGID